MKAKLVKESLNEKVFNASEEELDSSSMHISTYEDMVIMELEEITGETPQTIGRMCKKYSYLIETGYEDEDEPYEIAQNIWDLWLNDN